MEMFEACQLEQATSSNNLSCITSMLIFLVRLMTGMKLEESEKIEAALSPFVQQSQEQVFFFLKKIDQSRTLFHLFSSSTLCNNNYSFNFSNINCRKHRWFVWDSNLEPPNGGRRRNHGAIAATVVFYCLPMWLLMPTTVICIPKDFIKRSKLRIVYIR